MEASPSSLPSGEPSQLSSELARLDAAQHAERASKRRLEVFEPDYSRLKQEVEQAQEAVDATHSALTAAKADRGRHEQRLAEAEAELTRTEEKLASISPGGASEGGAEFVSEKDAEALKKLDRKQASQHRPLLPAASQPPPTPPLS
ncbi:MAG: hypothetical protein SGPRY_014544 [Prymnesium sp.]